MVGALSVVGSSVVKTHTCRCLCYDAMATANLNLKIRGDFILPKNSKKNLAKTGSLSISFIDMGLDRRLSPRPVNRNFRKQRRKNRGPVIVNEVAGQYNQGFDDVKLIKPKLEIVDLPKPWRIREHSALTPLESKSVDVETSRHELHESLPTENIEEERRIKHSTEPWSDLAEGVCA